MPIIWITISFFAGVISSDYLPWGIITWIMLGLGSVLAVGCVFFFKILNNQEITKGQRALILGLIWAFFLGEFATN